MLMSLKSHKDMTFMKKSYLPLHVPLQITLFSATFHIAISIVNIIIKCVHLNAPPCVYHILKYFLIYELMVSDVNCY